MVRSADTMLCFSAKALKPTLLHYTELDIVLAGWTCQSSAVYGLIFWCCCELPEHGSLRKGRCQIHVEKEQIIFMAMSGLLHCFVSTRTNKFWDGGTQLLHIFIYEIWFFLCHLKAWNPKQVSETVDCHSLKQFEMTPILSPPPTPQNS